MGAWSAGFATVYPTALNDAHLFLPFMMPALTAACYDAETLARLGDVAGSWLHRHQGRPPSTKSTLVDRSCEGSVGPVRRSMAVWAGEGYCHQQTCQWAIEYGMVGTRPFTTWCPLIALHPVCNQE
jgi:hypothetical protein